ncbi:hypothetical protein [Conexibacter sp. CPCC 206217]|uniref:hypothetical protein n=1 Tax=Conexibacter sp. CPCC 206217 TaxID=3064574 RepID=UPI00271E26AB|nr:hypothetical protein [Conexibacter sp. CPCC 206217]MDO8210417.1 hypothetical protein [Conexibacter sp. CPCC 206217]
MKNSPSDLSERLRTLPAAAPLLRVLGGDPRVFVVGGAVRDVLLGDAPLDLDLVVEGDAGEVAARLAEGLAGTVQLHDRFGTATVVADGRSYDLARARTERYARPGALPDVQPGTLEQDLRRRDFSVNAIAVAFDGRVAAVEHAFEDLAQRQLRVLHAESFREDPTRLLRLVRYATRLGFGVEPATSRLADEAIADGALRTVTSTRIGNELRLLLREPEAAAALAWIAGWGGGDALVPRLSFDPELAARARALLAPDGRPDLLLLAVATLRVGAPLAAWLGDLGFSARARDTVVAAAHGAARAGERLAAAGTGARRPDAGDGAAARAGAGVARSGGDERPSAIVDALRGASPELAALAGALGGETAAVAAARWRDELRGVRLAIDGDDLRAAGVPQGEAVGRGLAAALRAKLDGEADGRDAELSVAVAAANVG